MDAAATTMVMVLMDKSFYVVLDGGDDNQMDDSP